MAPATPVLHKSKELQTCSPCNAANSSARRRRDTAFLNSPARRGHSACMRQIFDSKQQQALVQHSNHNVIYPSLPNVSRQLSPPGEYWSMHDSISRGRDYRPEQSPLMSKDVSGIFSPTASQDLANDYNPPSESWSGDSGYLDAERRSDSADVEAASSATRVSEWLSATYDGSERIRDMVSEADVQGWVLGNHYNTFTPNEAARDRAKLSSNIPTECFDPGQFSAQAQDYTSWTFEIPPKLQGTYYSRTIANQTDNITSPPTETPPRESTAREHEFQSGPHGSFDNQADYACYAGGPSLNIIFGIAGSPLSLFHFRIDAGTHLYILNLNQLVPGVQHPAIFLALIVVEHALAIMSASRCIETASRRVEQEYSVTITPTTVVPLEPHDTSKSTSTISVAAASWPISPLTRHITPAGWLFMSYNKMTCIRTEESSSVARATRLKPVTFNSLPVEIHFHIATYLPDHALKIIARYCRNARLRCIYRSADPQGLRTDTSYLLDHEASIYHELRSSGQ
ncbi:hypothetical protein OPT61_g10351 [Boeremia exigua]|uniref:Uncharacterized protein n=1 Tax=Boeremia exigua TaxID=749465 RepID=A0ACC2HR06_9PLEO|nr:hypothetical protein OPT61_g10351 [Boeremia exigua]